MKNWKLKAKVIILSDTFTQKFIYYPHKISYFPHFSEKNPNFFGQSVQTYTQLVGKENY